tara:strand:+ start:1036 stop:1263 length:228 start_codon:yes stop_codon:yes gene_type:complete
MSEKESFKESYDSFDAEAYREYCDQLNVYLKKDPTELIEVIKRLGFKLDQTLSKIINQLDEVIELNDDEQRYQVK